jgi:hypothetical protein
MAKSINPMEQSKLGGDHKSRSAQLRARENEQKALAVWIKGATHEQIAASGIDGITTASGAWRAIQRALRRIPEADAQQARKAQIARLHGLRLYVWNNAPRDPFKAAEMILRIEAREARLLGLDAPAKTALTDEMGRGLIPLEFARQMIELVEGPDATYQMDDSASQRRSSSE